MTNAEHRIFSTALEDGSFIAASVDSPRFCVGAATEEEAFEKATRALSYYESVKKTLRTPKRAEVRVISPSFREEALCA
jgi:predicted RNase H-like HicB family nuclease